MSPITAAFDTSIALVAVVLAALGCGGTSRPPTSIAQTVQLNAPGEPVDVAAALVPDHVTVVDFWSASCEPCAVIGGQLAAAIVHEPRIVVRKVDVGDGVTPVARTYRIDALPHFDVYDRHRHLRYVLVGKDCVKTADLARALLGEP